MSDRGSWGNIPVKAVDHPLRRAIAGLAPHDLSRTLVGHGDVDLATPKVLAFSIELSFIHHLQNLVVQGWRHSKF